MQWHRQQWEKLWVDQTFCVAPALKNHILPSAGGDKTREARKGSCSSRQEKNLSPIHYSTAMGETQKIIPPACWEKKTI